jgi:hypothetical protein
MVIFDVPENNPYGPIVRVVGNLFSRWNLKKLLFSTHEENRGYDIVAVSAGSKWMWFGECSSRYESA